MKLRALFSCLLGIAVCAPFLHAAPVSPNETAADVRSRPSVPSPAQFDRATVERLLRDIDEPRHASLLKTGYFTRRGGVALPHYEGLELLDAAIDQAPLHSTRWFLLQNVKAAAIFQIGADTHHGLAAYSALFEAASHAAAAGALYPLRQSIGEYVQTATFRFRSMGLQDDPRAKETLLQAWRAHLATAHLPHRSWLPAPDFARAFEATGGSEGARTLVEAALADAAIPRTYTLLSTGALLLAPTEPQRAIALLREAATLLPTRPTREGGQVVQQLDVNEAARLYDRLVALLVAHQKTDEAIAAQRDRVAKTNDGRGALWLLLQRAGRGDEAAIVLGELKEGATPEIEVLRASRAWGQAKREETLRSAVEGARRELLESYLKRETARELALDLEARVTLGYLYEAEANWPALSALVSIERPAQMAPSEQSAWNTLARWREQLARREALRDAIPAH